VSEVKVDAVAAARSDTTTAVIDKTACREAEVHHGDLRKGAFLQRRADYRMQLFTGARRRYR
jgi:hypothetical protein